MTRASQPRLPRLSPAGPMLSLAVSLATLAACLTASTPALAACPGLAQVTASVSPAPTATYDPFAAGDTIVSMTVTVSNPANSVCDAAVTFQRAAGAAATMASGGSTLSYAIERSGGGTSLITQAGFTAVGTPPAANRIDFLNIPRQSSASAAIQMRIPAGQVVAAASYTDDLVLQVLRLNNAAPAQPNLIIRQLPVSPQATVVSKCVLPAPSVPSLNFTSAITNGRPNAGVVQTTTFSNVRCTAPTKLRLTGAALQPLAPQAPRPGFDNFINFRADGRFGGAQSVLTTSTSSASVDSAVKNTASGATTNGQITVDVSLVNGQPILAGTYSGVLTVSIDPSF